MSFIIFFVFIFFIITPWGRVYKTLHKRYGSVYSAVVLKYFYGANLLLINTKQTIFYIAPLHNILSRFCRTFIKCVFIVQKIFLCSKKIFCSLKNKNNITKKQNNKSYHWALVKCLVEPLDIKWHKKRRNKNCVFKKI